MTGPVFCKVRFDFLQQELVSMGGGVESKLVFAPSVAVIISLDLVNWALSLNSLNQNSAFVVYAQTLRKQ